MKGKTILMIDHRLPKIRSADEIVFIENGRIEERGTHDELVRLDGRYYGYL
jgi:ATP-binding cassette subfamily B protein IrtB